MSVELTVSEVWAQAKGREKSKRKRNLWRHAALAVYQRVGYCGRCVSIVLGKLTFSEGPHATSRVVGPA